MAEKIEHVNSFGVDWLRFAFVPILWEELVELLNIPLDKAKWFEAVRYNREWGCMLEEGVSVWRDKPIDDDQLEKRFLIDFSGNGLANWMRHRGQNAIDIIRMMSRVNSSPDMVSVNRIDLAFDDFEGLLDVNKICRYTKILKLAVTDWRSANYQNSWKIRTADEKHNDDVEGKTLYFGARNSLAFCRFYDKRAQVLSKMEKLPEEKHDDFLANRGIDSLPEHWVRCEIEFKREQAHAVAVGLLNADNPVDYALGVLRGRIDFKTKTGDKRIRRRGSVRWWERFTKSVERQKMRVPKPVKTVELTREWVEKSVITSIALLREADSEIDFRRWFEVQMKRGEARLSPEQQLAIEREKTRPRLETIEHGW